MANLCSPSGNVLLRLHCDGGGCVARLEDEDQGPAVLHLEAPGPGGVELRVRNAGIAPACFFYVLREDTGQRVNDFHELGVLYEERVGGCYGKNAGTIVAQEGEHAWFTLHASPAVEGSNGDSAPDLRNCLWTSPQQVVFVKTLTGRTHKIAFIDSMTVTGLKRAICEVEGIPLDQQRLVFTGRQLEDDVLLEDYGIRHESTLHLILRLRGGGDCAMPPSDEVAVAAVRPGAEVRVERRPQPERASPPLRIRVSVRS